MYSIPYFFPFGRVLVYWAVTDDGCGLLHMTQGNVYAFRPYEIISDDPGDLAKVLLVRYDTLEACEKCEIITVVYYDSNEQK